MALTRWTIVVDVRWLFAAGGVGALAAVSGLCSRRVAGAGVGACAAGILAWLVDSSRRTALRVEALRQEISAAEGHVKALSSSLPLPGPRPTVV